MIDYFFSLSLLYQCGVLVKRFYQEYKKAYPDPISDTQGETVQNLDENKESANPFQDNKVERC